MLPRSTGPSASSEERLLPSHPSRHSNMSNQSEEWNRNPGLMNKPSHGWLHPDQKITDNGICYGVRYIGCLEVNTSMKSLDFDTRSLVAKECINKLCEAAGLKTIDKKRKVDKRLLRMLAEKPNMDFAGSDVSLTITSSYLNLVSIETGEVIANHEMPNISFASGGDADTLDFVSYVAKDNRYGRACFVLECGGGLGQDVIITIGQAFELRYKRFLKRSPSGSNESVASNCIQTSVQNGNVIYHLPDDPEYYNDLPGKVPPDVATRVKLEAVISGKSGFISDPTPVVKMDANQNPKTAPVINSTTRADMTESLIDFAADLPNVCSYQKPEPEYVNTTAVIFNERLNAATAAQTVITDVFDMQPLSSTLAIAASEEASAFPVQFPTVSTPTFPFTGSSFSSNSNNSDTNLTSVMDKVKASVGNEPWFHGAISRKDSESLVVRDGDFLVRESQGSPGQYVLTGMQHGQRKHLLLVDPEGLIRTKDQVFESITHLVHYHMHNSLPIVSPESALLLKTPICKLIPVGKSIQV